MTDPQPYLPDGEVLLEFFRDRSKVQIIQGPVASGTSTCCCHKLMSLSYEQAPDRDGVRRTRWLIVRITYPELRDTTLKTWLDWFPEASWGDLVRSRPMVHHIRKPAGDGTIVDAEFIFIAVPDAETAEQVAASFEITGAWINEAQFHEKATLDEIESRCGRYPSMRMGNGASWYGVIADMNAPTEGHFVPYMRGDVPLPQHMDEDARREYETPEGWRFFLQPPGLIERKVEGRIVYEENPLAENQRHLKVPYLELIRGKSKEWIDRRVLNKVGLYSAGKPVYPTFSETDHCADHPIRVIERVPIFVGLDFGREPAAVFAQLVGAQWRILSELIGENESAERFAPRVKRHLAQMYGRHPVQIWGDPRGADGTQATETTAYDVFRANGMMVLPATTDNNPEMRRSATEAVLERRSGCLMDPSCTVLRTGMAGGYAYPPVKGVPGLYQERPRKNRYSHVVEAFENVLLGGGEGEAVIAPPERFRLKPSPARRHKVRLRR